MTRKKTGGTRDNLLSAASDIFADKGFRDATVAEICQQAGANISAVNYYFGSKEALYQEAWRHAFAGSIAAHPPDGGIGADAPAVERLGGQVRALIARIADENNRDFFISQMEFVNPTGLLAEVMRTAMNPLRENTLAVVRELLGPGVPEQSVNFCETCTISMCFHPMLIQRIRRRANDNGGPPAIEDIAAFADHVLQFALAGIAAIRGDAASGNPVARSAGTNPSTP